MLRMLLVFLFFPIHHTDDRAMLSHCKGDQDGLVVNTLAFGSEGPRFDPRPQRFVQPSAIEVAQIVTYNKLKNFFYIV